MHIQPAARSGAISAAATLPNRQLIAEVWSTPLGRDAVFHAERLATLMSDAGLLCYKPVATESNRAGFVTRAQFRYESVGVNAAILEHSQVQQVSVQFLTGSCESAMRTAVASLLRRNMLVLDMRITSYFRTGKIAAMEVTYVGRTEYERLSG